MNQQYLDKAIAVRTGEELDAAIIDPWLKQHIDGLEGDVTITQYTGGATCLPLCTCNAGTL